MPASRPATGSRPRPTRASRSAAQIPAKLGTVIGAELTIVGAPRRGKVPLRVVWRYPAAGPHQSGEQGHQDSDEYADTQLVGEKFPVFWGLTQDWHLVPGAWTLEVWHGERKLVSQPFQVVKP